MTKNADGMGMDEQINSFLSAGHVDSEGLKVMGHFEDPTPLRVRRGDLVSSFDNLVVTVGKNSMENIALQASGISGNAFMGLISSAIVLTIVAADTMSSHAGWLEAGNAHPPTYTGSRVL